MYTPYFLQTSVEAKLSGITLTEEKKDWKRRILWSGLWNYKIYTCQCWPLLKWNWKVLRNEDFDLNHEKCIQVEKFKFWPPIRPVYFAQNSFDAFFRVLARAHMIAFDCSGLIALREVHQLQDFFFVKKDDSISVKFVNCKLFNTRSLPGLFWLHLSRKYWSNWNTVRNCGEIQLNRCKKYTKRRSDPIWEECRRNCVL